MKNYIEIQLHKIYFLLITEVQKQTLLDTPMYVGLC